MLSKSLTTSLAPILTNSYWREADAERALAVWAQSGLTLSAFARHCGLSVTRLRRWKTKLEQSEGPRFHPVEIVSDEPELRMPDVHAAAIEVLVGPGHRIRVGPGFDAQLLRDVVEALSRC